MRASASCTSAVLLLAATACQSSTGPHLYDALPETAATVQAALDSVTNGVVPVPASCPTVNCPGGTPGAATITLTRVTATAVAQSARTFAYTATMKVLTANDIVVTLPVVGVCGLHIDTRPGTDSTIQVTGTATFVTDNAGGTPNRLSFSTPNLTTVAADDFALTGGLACAAGGGGSLSFFINILATTITPQFRQLCGAAGPDLFVACPVP